MADANAKQKSRNSITYRAYDYSLLFLTVFLAALGIVFIYSTSSYTATLDYNSGIYYVKRQAVYGVAGIVVMLVISRIDYNFYVKPFTGLRIRPIYVLYLLCTVLQILTLIPGIGVERGGARRWLIIPGIKQQFQPSEITKVMVIVLVAFICSQVPKALNYFGGFVGAAIISMPPIILVTAEDLSTGIVLAGIFILITFVVSKKYWYFLAAGGAFIAAVGAFIFFGDAFRLKRIDAWLNVDTHEYAYQIRRGLYAISSGGFVGKGLGKGSMKLGYVPEAHNDMIFSIICEELGLIGAVAIILLFVLLLWRIVTVAVNAPDLFGSLLCVGVFAHISLQVIMNIAVVTNSIPSTGIPLPFISYGGTALVLLLCEIGMVLSVSYRIENKG